MSDLRKRLEIAIQDYGAAIQSNRQTFVTVAIENLKPLLEELSQLTEKEVKKTPKKNPA